MAIHDLKKLTTNKQINKQTNNKNRVLDNSPVSFQIGHFFSVTCLTPISYFDLLPWTKQGTDFQTQHYQ